MIWFLIGIIVLIAVLFLGRAFLATDPKTLAQILRWGGVGAFLIVAVFLIVTGRYSLLLPALIFLAPLARRWFQGGRLFPRPTPSTGQASDVETDYLSMSLDHDSGRMTGRIKRGSFAGRELEELSHEEAQALLEECRAADPDAARLLEAYIERIFGKVAEEAGTSYESSQRDTLMARDEAFEILGLAPGASVDDIKDAHRRLMMKIHPDQGGSNYLAAKINQAKEVLLGSSTRS